ncbi:MAG: hypothetical protein HY349_08425 [Nitrospirae bacterium]|nr:hypothetical protein [Nitrospirota bacterium]
MNTRELLFMFLVLAVPFSTAYAGHVAVGEPYLQPNNSFSHRSISATVKKVVSDLVFLRTEESTVRTHGMKEIKKDGMPSIKEGDQVDLILDRRANTILAIAPPRGTGAYIGDEVTGTVQRFDWLNKRISLKTEEGDIQSLELRDAVVTKLIGVDKGRPIVLEMDGHHRAFDAYRPE